MANTVRVTFCAIVGQFFKDSGYADGKPTVRTTKTPPKLDPHEVPVWVTLELPEGLFKRPRLAVAIKVPDEQAPIKITPEVQSNIADIITQQLGVNVTITTNQPEESE
jgi:hypothetical protein